MATGQNIDWHSDSQQKLHNDTNLIACDFLHVPDLINGNLTFVRQKHCTGVSLNQCEIIDDTNIIINWKPIPLANVASYQTSHFKNGLLKCMYRDLNELQNELLIAKDQIEENENDKDSEMKNIKQNTKVLLLSFHKQHDNIKQRPNNHIKHRIANRMKKLNGDHGIWHNIEHTLVI